MEMRDGVVGIAPDPRLVRARTTRHHQILEEVVRRILETGGPLRGRAPTAAEIELATGERGAASASRSHFEDINARPGVARLDRRASAGDAETDDQNIGFRIPPLDVVQTQWPGW